MSTVAWFHCFSGIAGDMALGALLDAGADVAEVEALVRRLPVGGWQLTAERVQRAGVSSTRAMVKVDDDVAHPHRPWRVIDDLLRDAPLPARVAERARHTFRRLAEVEGRLHGIDPSLVELHEVGAVDAVVDVVGVCAALEVLGVDEVRTSAVAVGTGTVRTAHGTLPNPAPATLALLAGANLPTYGLDVDVELTTPTGAALLATLAVGVGPLPALVPVAVGFGGGGHDLPDRPNTTQVVVGTSLPDGRHEGPGQPVDLVEVNVDDTTGEVLAHTIAALLEAGAHDAWVTPIVAKKGRPAHTVHALCDPARTPHVAATLAAESGSLGVRATSLHRWPLRRIEGVVNVQGEPVRVKLAQGRVKVEFEDAAAAARRLRLPLRAVLIEAEAEARSLEGPG